MKLSTIQDAINAEIDEPILAIRGTITRLYKQMSGEGQYGAWTLQTGIIQDKTGEMRFLLGNAPVLDPKYKDELVEFRCSKGSKGGWTGIKRSVDKKDKKPTITINDKAEIILMKDELQMEPEDEELTQQTTKQQDAPANGAGGSQGASDAPSKGTTAGTQERRPETRSERMARGIGILTQLANCQYAALALVREYLVPMLKGRGIEIDAVQEATLVQNMLIQGYRHNVHTLFPEKQFPLKKAAQEQEPSADDLDQSGPEKTF